VGWTLSLHTASRLTHWVRLLLCLLALGAHLAVPLLHAFESDTHCCCTGHSSHGHVTAWSDLAGVPDHTPGECQLCRDIAKTQTLLLAALPVVVAPALVELTPGLALHSACSSRSVDASSARGPPAAA
jgi:hypothetical protein